MFFFPILKFSVKQVESSGKQSTVCQDGEHKLENSGTSLSLSGIVYSLFQAQFHSVVKCPVCRKESSSIEPFLFVPLPLPDASFSVLVMVVLSHPHHSMVETSVNVSCSASIRDLRSAVAAASSIPTEQACCIIFVEL